MDIDSADPMAPHDESVSERSFGLTSDTLEQYATKCDRETGLTVPDFDCDVGGTEVPTTGIHGDKCDRPNVLNSECDKGSKFHVLVNNSKGYVVAHCRKEDNATGKFGDIAVIQHNKQNGATCFYQALQGWSGHPLDGTVKAPSRGADAWEWGTPAATAGVGCAGCHDNGPIIRSPYLNQITGDDRLPGADEIGFNKTEPYRFVGNDFATWRVQKVEVEGNLCNTCHRMGTNNVRTNQGTARDLGLRATAQTQTAKNPHSTTSPIWMIPGQNLYQAATRAAAEEIADCAEAYQFHDPVHHPLPAGCKVTDYTAPDDKFEDGSRWREGWCRGKGEQFGRGDFNGDGKQDFYCHGVPGEGTAGKTWVMLSNGHDFVDGSVWMDDWCSHAGSKIYPGDFNGDGKTDILCKDEIGSGSEGRTWVALSDGHNFSSAGRWQDGWCRGDGATFGLGDFNGDKKVDLWCHDAQEAGSEGRTWVALSNGSDFTGGGRWREGWCRGKGEQFLRADFNGDGKQDFLCHDAPGAGSQGRTWVMTSDGDSFTDGSVWKEAWCRHEGSKIGVGDFNGDGKADIYCRDPFGAGSEGRTWVALSDGHNFGGGPVWRDNWCKAEGALFGVGDFNGDKKADIWCHDPMGAGSLGRTWVATSNGSTGFGDGSVWKDDWCRAEGALFGVGEFDGDHKSDIWCHDAQVPGSEGRTWVATAP